MKPNYYATLKKHILASMILVPVIPFILLFNNAMDAIIEKKGSQGGEITITTGREYDGSVEISVKDDGCGISPENLKRVFVPFFTTKPVGKGTGLGLSVCYGIIENMGGEMDVISEKNVGSYFKISLPAKGSIS
ncbi:MAG: ATP-binding protein [Pseudomonadota bacterium]